ncbi:MAG: hypothetical protein AAF962_17045 [Actinomycetota bacterium]
MRNQHRPPAPSPGEAETALPPEVLAWAGFLAGCRLNALDHTVLGAVLAAEGPLAVFTLNEARRALRELEGLDRVGRAHCWVAMRTAIHAAEATMGHVRLSLGVLHRHDPVVVPPDGVGYPVVTERSVAAWSDLRRTVCELAGVEGAPSEIDVGDLRRDLRERGATPGALQIRRRVGHGPVAQAAVDAVLAGADAELRRGIEVGAAALDPTDVEQLDAHIERLWTGAELDRLTTVVRSLRRGA